MILYIADMNHANPVNFGRMAKAGVVGVIHKATQGVGFTDEAYQVRRAMAVGAGLLWGAYDFNMSDNIPEDVKKFVSVAQPDAHTIMALDYERNPKSEMTFSQALDFMEELDQQLGRVGWLYGGDKIKRDIIQATQAQRDFLAQHPFWGCEYGPRWKNWDDNGQPLPWPAPTFWQYTGDGVGPGPHTFDGLEQGADLSSFNGTLDQLKQGWM
jgi:lysozyme